MRLSFRTGFVLVGLLAFVAVTSCGDDGGSSNLGIDGDAGNAPIAQDGSAGAVDSGAPVSTMRIAHLAPGFGPIDFCYRGARSGTFVGPVLRGPAPPKTEPLDGALDGEADDAGAVDASSDADAGSPSRGRAEHRTVSKYLELEASGPVTIAIVGAGATSCANALATGNVTLDPGKLATVVLFGQETDGGAAIDIAAFTDDRSVTDDTKVRVRVIHAALGTPAVPGAGALAVRMVAAKTTLLTDRVEPRRASTPSTEVMVDALGYVTASPIPAPASIAIGPASTDGGADAGFDPWQSLPADLDIRGGSLHTAFVLSGPTEGTFEVLWCADTTTSDDQTTCARVE